MQLLQVYVNRDCRRARCQALQTNHMPACMPACQWTARRQCKRCVQASEACATEPECLFFSMDGWPKGDTAKKFAQSPGVNQAALHLGYIRPNLFLDDATMYLELVPMLSRFCICPPGDTPKRRAFIDSIMAGCAACLRPSHSSALHDV